MARQKSTKPPRVAPPGYKPGKGRPPINEAIKPGEVRNPAGGQTQNPEMKTLKRLSKQQFVEVGNLVIQGDIEALQEIVKDKKQSVFKVMLASIAVKIIQKGDMAAMDKLLDRFIGKVKDEIHHTGIGDSNTRVIVTMPSNGREKI